MNDPTSTRRRFLAALAAAGGGAVALTRLAAAAVAQPAPVSAESIRRAAWLSGVALSDKDVELMNAGVKELRADLEKLRAVKLDNSVAPALLFDPEPGRSAALGPRRAPVTGRGVAQLTERVPPARPASDTDLAFMPVAELAPLVRTRAVSAVELAKLSLERLRRHDRTLRAVITYTEELALRQAEKTDAEIQAGRYRGPLHGIPWGAKDLLAVPGFPTTWGAGPYRDQVRPETATVVSRLEEAGAVLVAKLSVGELAWGDVWYDAMTRSPWDPEQGSSGSSAGSAAATAAGLVSFGIGTETLGSIVSPCTRCGTTGLRPTFGRVSRHGAMALAWSMDKVGPIARDVEDCAVVLSAIHGADGFDPSAVERAFEWPSRRDVRSLRVGFVPALFEEDRTAQAEDDADKAALREWAEHDRATLKAVEALGITPVPVELGDEYPVGALGWILTVEAATAFDELTRTGRDDQLVRQIADAWPNVFRLGQLVPAVEYLRANRVRTLVMRDTERALRDIDVLVTPSYGGDVLLRTNLTGHPCVVLPNGFTSRGRPTSITFIGRLYGESDLLALALAYQRSTDFHLRRPPVGSDDGAAGAPRP